MPAATRGHRAPIGLLALAFALPALALGPRSATAQEAAVADGDKGGGGFAEVRTGEVPLNSLEMITSETERAIENGLQWLAAQQRRDGSFASNGNQANLAVTALAGLAFMGAGSTPGRGPYGDNIEKALQYVLDNTTEAGFIVVQGSMSHGPMYSHGFATMFLAEAYGMTKRPEIREKLEKAVRLIVNTQNKEGGWRYQPMPRDADVSVTVAQINALRAARNAGIYIPKETVENCVKYCRNCQNPDGGFRYMTTGGPSAFPRSAAGLVALYSAAIYDEKEIDRAIEYLLRFVPSPNANQGNSAFNHYFYGQYYAAQAFWIRGGDEWNQWFPAIRDELLRKQMPQGYWNDQVSREYGTAMALIVLQMPNNILPIFQR